jgi:HEAT repeat protein
MQSGLYLVFPEAEGRQSVTEDLLQALKSKKSANRWQAATHLLDAARAQRQEVLAALAEALEDDHPFVRWRAGLTLAEVDRPGATAALLGALEKGSTRQQAAAADALAYARGANAEPLIRALDSEEAPVRQSAAEALGRQGYRPAVSRLIALLEDESPWVRRAAIQAMGHIGDSRGVAPLTRCLTDESPWVRRSATYALGAIRAQQAVPKLVAILDDPDPQLRRNAAWALGRIGDTAALPKLHALRADTALDGKVAKEAEAAIYAIQRPSWQRLPGAVQKWLTRRAASTP